MPDRNIHGIATDLPTIRIFSEGQEIDGAFAVQSVFVHRAYNKISETRLSILDGDIPTEDFPASNEDTFAPGKEIEIKMGYSTDEETVFKGIIVKHGIRSQNAASSILELTIKDAAVKMTVNRENKYFTELTDADIVEEIIANNNLESEVATTDVTHAEMVQYYVTDWDFIVTRAEANGMLILTEDGKVVMQKPDTAGSPVLDLVYGQNIVEFETEIDARYQYEGVTAQAWDYSNQEVLEIEGNDPGVTETGNMASTDLASVIGLDALNVRHTGRHNNEELQAWSDAQLLRSRLAKVRGRVRIIGYSEIKPGDMIQLGGLGDRFNGPAFVSGVSHVYGPETAWYTDLHIGLESRWLVESFDDIEAVGAGGLVSGIRGLQIGIVTAIHEDPEGEDRIKVRLPILDPENEGVWARVATLDAGENRGSFFRPEIDDEVILGFLNDDPRDAIVIGMVHSSAKPAPITAAEENDEKGFVTRSEMKLLFDDGKVSITLETPNGNKIVLSDDEGSIKMEDENGNSLLMDSNGIQMESGSDILIKAGGNVTIEGTNVEQKAGASFKAEGSAGMEISSSATTVVKGSLVQIN